MDPVSTIIIFVLVMVLALIVGMVLAFISATVLHCKDAFIAYRNRDEDESLT